MALCSFADVSFDLEGDDGAFFPLPTLGVDGPPEIALTILLYSRADARTLYDYRTRVTPRLAVGQFAGRVVTHAGAGARTLLLPTGEGLSLEAYSAILTDLALERQEFTTTIYRARASWLILSDPLP